MTLRVYPRSGKEAAAPGPPPQEKTAPDCGMNIGASDGELQPTSQPTHSDYPYNPDPLLLLL